MIKSIDLCLRFCVNCFICLFFDKRYPYTYTYINIHLNICIYTVRALIKKFIKLFPVSREETGCIYSSCLYIHWQVGTLNLTSKCILNVVNVKHRTVHLYWLKLLSKTCCCLLYRWLLVNIIIFEKLWTMLVNFRSLNVKIIDIHYYYHHLYCYYFIVWIGS